MNKFFILWLWLLRLASGSQDIKILPPLKAISNGRAGMRPHHERTAAVHKLLDEAPDGAHYKNLIAHVREQSGVGCSRRTIAAWKKKKS